MTTRTEQEFAVITERLVVHISGNRIGTRLLFGEGDIIIHSITFGKLTGFLFHQFLEKFAVFGRHGKMYVHFATLSGCIHGAFSQMFL